jgi:hypothetical protein
MIERALGFAFRVLGRIRPGEQGEALRHVGAELERLADRRRERPAASPRSPRPPA